MLLQASRQSAFHRNCGQICRTVAEKRRALSTKRYSVTSVKNVTFMNVISGLKTFWGILAAWVRPAWQLIRQSICPICHLVYWYKMNNRHHEFISQPFAVSGSVRRPPPCMGPAMGIFVRADFSRLGKARQLYLYGTIQQQPDSNCFTKT